MPKAKYDYSTSPRKLEPEYRPTKRRNNIRVVEDVPRQKVKVSAEQKKKKFEMTVVVIAIFTLFLTISYRNSQINEKFNEMQSLKKELSSLQKENEQLKVNIANGLNLTTIEKLAKEKLGMQKLTNKQIVYVNLPKKDHVEVENKSTETENETSTGVKGLFNKLFANK